MFKRIFSLIAIAVIGALALTGCAQDLGSTKSLHGDAAKAALTKVVETSAADFNKDGGTEQITLGSQQFGLVYDPKEPVGKQVALFDVATDGPSQLSTVDTIFLLAIPKLLEADLFKGATYEYANNGFTVTSSKAILTVQILDNRVNGTLLKGVAAGGPTQATINNYGVNEIAKAKLLIATPAPSPTPSAN